MFIENGILIWCVVGNWSQIHHTELTDTDPSVSSSDFKCISLKKQQAQSRHRLFKSKPKCSKQAMVLSGTEDKDSVVGLESLLNTTAIISYGETHLMLL